MEKVTRIKNDEILLYINEKKPFANGNGTATAYLINNIYSIFSYNTKILEISPNNEILEFQENFFSRTTTKLQNIIKQSVFFNAQGGKNEN